MNQFVTNLSEQPSLDNQYYHNQLIPAGVNNLPANVFGIDDCLKFDSHLDYNQEPWQVNEVASCPSLVQPDAVLYQQQQQLWSDDTAEPQHSDCNSQSAVNGKQKLKAVSRKVNGSKKETAKIPKPVSAYALFFRDAQASIKGSNPNASFGEISKVVASNWENLDKANKDVYKRRAEQEKKNYLKALAASRAKQIAGLMDQAKLGLVSDQSAGGDKTEVDSSKEDKLSQEQQKQQPPPAEQNESKPAPDNGKSTQPSQPATGAPTNNPLMKKCVRAGCNNPAVVSSEWDAEYCSADCCVKHCAEVFNAWVEEQQEK